MKSCRLPLNPCLSVLFQIKPGAAVPSQFRNRHVSALPRGTAVRPLSAHFVQDSREVAPTSQMTATLRHPATPGVMHRLLGAQIHAY